MTKLARLTLPLATAALTLIAAGCSNNRGYYAAAPPPPPPVYGGASMLMRVAESNGFRDGNFDGRRDAINRFGYRPQRDGKFRATPGYDRSLGPFGPYRDFYRGAYLRGYERGYARRD